MIGNQYYINNKILRDPTIPVSDLRTIEVVMDMYWDEFKKLCQDSDKTVIQVTHLGTWYADNTLLRAEARRIIRLLRRIRQKETYKNKGEGTMAIYNYHINKLRTIWKQMNHLRYIFIERDKKNKKKKNEKINISLES